MAAHLYYRLLVTAVNANQYVGISEVELFDATYADVTPGAAVTHSSRLSSAYNGSNVIDDDNSTLWHTNGATVPSVANPEWVKIQLTSAKDIIAFTVRARQDGASYVSDQAPKDFKLQWSDDGATWTDLFSITAQTGWGISGERRYYNASGTSEMVPPPPSAAVGTASKRFWRLRSLTVDGDPNAVGITDLEFHTSVGGGQAATGGTAYAGNTLSGNAAACFDSAVSDWGAGDTKEWVGYLFATATEVVEAVIKARSAEFDQAPKDFVIEYWDGSAFQTAYTHSGATGWTASESRTFTWGAAAAAARPQVFICT